MSFFFKHFPKINYSFINEKNNKKRIVTNILTAFFLRKIGFNRSLIFQYYTIRDDDSIESLSNKLYNTTMYYWTLLVVNNIINPYTEWSMPQTVLEKFTEKKYKNGIQIQKKDKTYYTLSNSIGLYGINHFFNIKTQRKCDDVDEIYYREMWNKYKKINIDYIIPITNFEHEKNIDIENRKIQIVGSYYISNFQEDFSKMLRK